MIERSDRSRTRADSTPPAVNASELLDRVGGDRRILRELTDLFQADYPRQVRFIRQAIDQGNAVRIEQASHALKGALSNLSADEAIEVAVKLERLGATGELREANMLLSELEQKLAKTIDSLETLCLEPHL